MVSDWVDPIALFKLIEKFVLKQSDNQYKTEVLIAKQLSILHFCQDDQVGNATWYGCFITRVGGGLPSRTSVLVLHTRPVGDQGYRSCPFWTLKCSRSWSRRGSSSWSGLSCLSLIAPQQQCKDAQPIEEGRTNDYSKGNSEVNLANMHQTLTLMYDYTPLKLDTLSYLHRVQRL